MKTGLIKPKKLKAGDKVATVSLSWGGPAMFPQRYEAGKRQLMETFGLSVVEMPNTFKDDVWLKANPQARADDLMQAFSDPTINAIISTIGGSDSIRILPYLEPDLIQSNPKIFMGFSDSTISHLACYKADLITFYGPAIMAGFAENGGIFPYMIDSIYKTLFSSTPIGSIAPNCEGWTVEKLEWANPENQQIKRKTNPCSGWKFLQGSGIHQGYLIGGCLEVLDWLRGTNYWPDPAEWQGAILFLETSEDAPPPNYLLSTLRSYAAIGFLKKLAGILFGRPGGQMPKELFEEYDNAILQVIRDEEGLTELPIITHMDFGHTDPMFILPYGVMAEIDCDKNRFTILENAVCD